MKKENEQSNTRQQILQAVNQLVLAEGVNHLTLEAVAKKAGVSKGGLLYHFPSKEALIKGLIEHLNGQFDSEVARRLAEEEPGQPEAAGRWLRAFVRATFEAVKGSQPGSQLSSQPLAGNWMGSNAAILTAIATDPQLLEPFRKTFAAYQRQAEQDGIDPALATVIRLAADGLWLAELLGLAPPGDKLRGEVERLLLEMSRGKLLEAQ